MPKHATKIRQRKVTLEFLRKTKLCLTRKQTAERLGIPHYHYYQIEAKFRNATPDLVPAFVAVFGGTNEEMCEILGLL